MNAIISEKEAAEVVEFRAPGPGERLRNARVARDMDIAKVAERIHLTTDMVDALECDDYSELPARVFVRGYVRNYARLVELPSESILAQFDELWPENEAQVKVNVTSAPRLATDTQPGHAWPGAVTWVLLLAGVGLFLVWWQGYLDRFTQSEGSAPAAMVEQAPAATEQAAGSLALPLADVQATDPQPEAAIQTGSGLLALPPAAPAAPAAAPEPVPAAVQSDAAGVEQQAEAQAGAAAQTGALSPAETAAAEQPAESEALQTPVAETEPAPEPPVTEPVQAAPEQGVVLRFSDDCWVDVRDSEQSFRLFGTKRKGTEHRLGGEPPYKLVLGNAAAVEVLVNGQPFDLKAHTRDTVARFSLSP